MSGATGDTRALRQLAHDLGVLGSPQTVENVETAVGTTAHLVKNTWNGKLYGPGSAASRTGGSISYDVGVAHDFDLFAMDLGDVKSSTIIAEIGPKAHRGRQAGVVRLIENGSINNAPQGLGGASLDEHESDFEIAIAFAERVAAGRVGLG